MMKLTNLTAKTGILMSQVPGKYDVGVDPGSLQSTPTSGQILIGTGLYEAKIAKGRIVGRDIQDQLRRNLEALTGRSYSERHIRSLVASHVLAKCSMVGHIRTIEDEKLQDAAEEIIYEIKPANVAESRYKKPGKYTASFRMIGPHEADEADD